MAFSRPHFMWLPIYFRIFIGFDNARITSL
jgi:hypothetical protein